ncbi:MAG: hypothetical protein ACTSUE_01585 [Promethearchaeota archaeon]
MVLKFSIKLLENIVGGWGKVEYFKNYIDGIEQVWDYQPDKDKFVEIKCKQSDENESQQNEGAVPRG